LFIILNLLFIFKSKIIYLQLKIFFKINENSIRFIREYTFNLTTSEADSEFLTRVALFTIKENVTNFFEGAMTLDNMNFIKNLENESYFSLKVSFHLLLITCSFINSFRNL